MSRYLLYVFILLIIPLHLLYAQGENNNWTFGFHRGISFNTSPISFFQNNNTSWGASSSVSDAAGQLLFYSNGNKVWDAAGNIMPNGDGILGNDFVPGGQGGVGYPGSTMQGVYIVQSVGNSRQYYLFTLEASQLYVPVTHPGAMRYSIIDMSLNGGMGDVVAGQKNIVVDISITEAMTVIKGDGCYYWLITQRFATSAYRVYKIDAAGIHAPVSYPGIIPAPASADAGYGMLIASPDGRTVATGNIFSSGIELFSFDRSTGVISNNLVIDATSVEWMTLGFSPDNHKLYKVSVNSATICQFDLTLFPNAAAIDASRVIAFSGYNFGAIRNGPDGKLYINCYDTGVPFLGIVNNPNNTGSACNFTTIPLSATVPPVDCIGLGNNAVTGASIDTFFHKTDTLVCSGNTYGAAAQPGCDSYVWSDGSTSSSRTLTENGVYWVYATKGCHVELDTFRLRFEHLEAVLGPDTFICPGGSLTLDAIQPGATYRWQDNSTAATYVVNSPGLYFVTTSRNSCTVSDSVSIREIDPRPVILEGDTTICTGKSIILHAVNPLPGTTLWNNGMVLPELIVHEAGTYTVHTTNQCGVYDASATLSIEPCDCRPFIPNIFSPNGDGHNDFFLVRVNCHATQFILRIFNRFGQCVYEGQIPEQGWDGTFKGLPEPSNTYFYQVQYYGPEGQFINKKGDIILVR